MDGAEAFQVRFIYINFRCIQEPINQIGVTLSGGDVKGSFSVRIAGFNVHSRLAVVENFGSAKVSFADGFKEETNSNENNSSSSLFMAGWAV